MQAALTMVAGVLICFAISPAFAETAVSQDDPAALLARVEALERKVQALERECGTVRSSTPASATQSVPAGGAQAPHRVVVRQLVNGGGDDQLAIGAMCEAAIDGALAAHGYRVATAESSADAEIDVTITYTWLSSVGAHGSVGDVRLEYFAAVKSSIDGTTLLTVSNDHTGGASSVCRRLADGLIAKTAPILLQESGKHTRPAAN